jgi:hypothetical protein
LSRNLVPLFHQRRHCRLEAAASNKEETGEELRGGGGWEGQIDRVKFWNARKEIKSDGGDGDGKELR